MTWTLVPPKPNELTPARRGRPGVRGHGVVATGMAAGMPSVLISGLRRFRCRCGGMAAACREMRTRQTPGKTGGSLKVADVRLDGGDQQGAIGLPAAAVDIADGAEFDGVAQGRAGAMGFDAVDVRGRKPGVMEGFAQQAGLGRRLGAVRPLLRPSWLTAEPRTMPRMGSWSFRALSSVLRTSTTQPSART